MPVRSDARLLSGARRCGAAGLASLALLAAPAAQAQGAGELQPFSGRYRGQQKIALITATATADIALRRSPRFVVYTMDSTITWAFIERRFHDCAVLRIEGDRLMPIEYVHRDEARPDLDIHTRFDWPGGTANTQLGRAPDPRTVDLSGPTWDPMSFQVALMALAPLRRPGDKERHRVIERGSLKEHEVTFAGPVEAEGGAQRVHEILSRKEKGLIALRLLPDQAWRPGRVTIDEVTIELLPTPVPSPAPLPNGSAPSCGNGSGG